MIQAVEIFCIFLFVLFACFYFGKKWGERKYFSIKQELKAHELAFNQLLERMEMVSTHNLKLLETKTEELKDLVPIIDKKLLYANDILESLENGSDSLSHGSSRIGSPNNSAELKLRREVQELVYDMKTRLQALEIRLEIMETQEKKRQIREQTQISSIAAKTPLEVKPLSALPKELIKEKFVPTSIVSPKKVKELSLTMAGHLEGGPVHELKPPTPEPGTIFHEVIDLQKQGNSLHQIARKLKIGLGEAELILKIYGSGSNYEPLRKVT